MARWSFVVLEDVHGLWGGANVSVSHRGDVWAVVVERTGEARRYHGKLPPEALHDLERIVATRALAPLVPGRPPVPDEATARLTLVPDDGGTVTVASKHSGDRDPAFDAIASFLSDVARTFARNATPVATGRWNGRTLEPS